MSKKTEPHEIKEMFAFIGFDEKENAEGVPAVKGEDGSTLPMIASDRDRVDFFRPLAVKFAKDSGVKIRLVRFGNREVLEEF